MTKAQTLKTIIKKNVGENPTFGTDPKDPWSAKANINETALLNRYLKSRGINPQYATKDQKVAHSKTNQFKAWMRNHLNDTVNESVDKKDTITFDIPLLIRVLEFAREELKSDVNLHQMVERLISMRGKGTLTMNQYGVIVKEEFDQLDEASQEKFMEAYNGYHNNRTGFAKRPREDDEYHTPDPVGRTHKIVHTVSKDGGEKHSRTVTISNSTKSPEEAKATARAHLEKQGYTIHEGVVDAVKKAWKAVSDFDSMQPKYDGNTRRRQALKKKLADNKKKVSEAKEADYGGDYQASVQAVKQKAAKKPVDMKSLAARMQASYKKDAQKNVKENTMDPMAATQTPNDCANQPDDVEPSNKNKKLIQMSKSARIIKNIYKKKNMTEETYDHEKEDKSVATYGKKPRVQKGGMDSTMEKPQAAAVLTGGTTLTGEKRDTIEIDPMLKMRKQPADAKKSV